MLASRFNISQAAALSLVLTSAALAAQPVADAGFAWEQKADRLSITHAGRPVADYVFRDAAILRPHFQNLRAPSGVQVTRNHPAIPGEPSDHATMHPGVWLAFGDISGQDFWRNKARIEHVAFSAPPALQGGNLTFATRNRLLASDGSPLGTQESRFTLARSSDSTFLLTWSAEIRGEGRELIFGDQEEMGLGVRVATELTEKSGGLVVNSDGQKGAKAAWGKSSAWATYSREIDGRIRGAAIFPAATNPNPTWWHSRDYGVIVANGFGKRVLPPAANGRLVLPAGSTLRLRYGILLFDAPAATPIDFAQINRQFQALSAQP
jgi:hypothetical protein